MGGPRPDPESGGNTGHAGEEEGPVTQSDESYSYSKGDKCQRGQTAEAP